MWKVLFICLVVSCTIAAAQQTQCTQNSQCAADECCYYHEGPMVVSRKRQLFFPVLQTHQGGWCEKYKVQGQRCDGISKMNGHCECGPGLTCKWIPDPTTTLAPITAMLLHPRNARMIAFGGHGECQPI